MTEGHDDPGSGAGVDDELEHGAAIDTVDGPPPLELRPRSGPAAPAVAAHRRRKRRLLVGGVLVVLLGAAGILVSQLNSATTYFYTADKAVQKRPSLGSKTFRVEGTVVGDPRKVTSADGERLDFDIAFNGVGLTCHYFGGEPSALFKAGEPVVLVGHFNGDAFAANQILVKHDAQYKAKHPDRVSPSGP